jgi:hypothetical protein
MEVMEQHSMKNHTQLVELWAITGLVGTDTTSNCANTNTVTAEAIGASRVQRYAGQLKGACDKNNGNPLSYTTYLYVDLPLMSIGTSYDLEKNTPILPVWGILKYISKQQHPNPENDW